MQLSVILKHFKLKDILYSTTGHNKLQHIREVSLKSMNNSYLSSFNNIIFWNFLNTHTRIKILPPN